MPETVHATVGSRLSSALTFVSCATRYHACTASHQAALAHRSCPFLSSRRRGHRHHCESERCGLFLPQCPRIASQEAALAHRTGPLRSGAEGQGIAITANQNSVDVQLITRCRVHQVSGMSPCHTTCLKRSCRFVLEEVPAGKRRHTNQAFLNKT